VPQVIFLGPFYSRRYPDGKGEFIRNKAVFMSQAWLDLYRGHLPSAKFLVTGDEVPIPDEGNSGTPDKNWKVKDIKQWLDGYGMAPVGYATKGSLLQLVDNALNPTMAEEVVEEAEEQTEIEEKQESDE
jgi:hypothetical protein